MRYFFILLLAITAISCSKSKRNNNTESNGNMAVKYFDIYNSNKEKNKLDNESNLIKSFTLIKLQKNDFKTRSLLSDIVVELYKNNNVNLLDESTKLLFDLSQSSHDSINLGVSYRYRANFFYVNQVLDSSYYYNIKAEKIYIRLKDNKNLGNILMNKGIVQYSIGDYLGAELSLNKANTIFKSFNNFNKIYSSLDQLGLVSIELKEYEKGLFYFNSALKAIENLPLNDDKIYFKSVCLNNIGYLYLKSSNYKKGVNYFELALKNNRLIKNNPSLYSNLIDNLAYCRLKSNHFEDLPNLFFEALKIREKLNDDTVVVLSNLHLSEYYSEFKENKKAIFYSQKALEIAKKSKVPINIVSSLKQASLVDKINSSKYSEDYIRISDSLQLAERNSKDRFARIELETEQIKKENVFLEEKNRDILNYFMGTMAIAGLLFFMRAQRAKSREIILKQAQQKANEDIYKLIISQQGKIDEGRIMEKTRIAKELHDGVLGRMFGLRLNLDGLNHRTDDEAVAERIRCLEELKIIEQDLREISHELSREKYVLINNFVAIVNNLLEEQTKINTAVLSATIGEDIDWELLSNTTKINLYRILQESLQNINKYAQAKTIKVDLRKDKKGNLVLNIVDDGVGFETDKNSKGIGLKNIVTRTHESEGIIDIKSSKNKGTQIKVTVPLENKSIKI